MWSIGGINLSSRLFLGTAQYPTLGILEQCLETAQPGAVTTTVRRHKAKQGHFWQALKNNKIPILPNTAGCLTANEAVTIAQMSREVFETNWIKLEITIDDKHWHPNPWEILNAFERLSNDGFIVFPYMSDDLALATRLYESGCRIMMPGAAPIGSGLGITDPFSLRRLRHLFPDIQLIVDAGIGKPSEATILLEWGFDGILTNSAVALSRDPVNMAKAFHNAVIAGQLAHHAGLIHPAFEATGSTDQDGHVF